MKTNTRRRAAGSRRALTASIGSASLVLTSRAIGTAQAIPPIILGYTASLGFNGAFVAQDRGFFAQRGLEAQVCESLDTRTVPGRA